MRKKVLFIMASIMLISIAAFGVFAFPIGIPACSAVGLIYSIKSKDRRFMKWCSMALVAGIACIIYTLLVINNM